MESQHEQRHGNPGLPRQEDSHRLISEAAYGPENLKLICEAFDRAWAAIAPIVERTPLAHEAARLKLANMILNVASNDRLDQARVKSAG